MHVIGTMPPGHFVTVQAIGPTGYNSQTDLPELYEVAINGRRVPVTVTHAVEYLFMSQRSLSVEQHPQCSQSWGGDT